MKNLHFIYLKTLFRLIWGFIIRYSVINFEYTLSVCVLVIPLIAVLIYNFIIYRDFNIFKNDLDRSIIFLEKYLKEYNSKKFKNS
jgi:hypothetical protein